MLDIAATAGADTAPVCARALSDDPGARAGAVKELKDLQSTVTDAADFLGIAAWTNGDKISAHHLWGCSAQQGDVVAPLRLQHTTAG